MPTPTPAIPAVLRKSLLLFDRFIMEFTVTHPNIKKNLESGCERRKPDYWETPTNKQHPILLPFEHIEDGP